MNSFWKKVQSQFKDSLSHDLYGTWFSRIEYVPSPENENNGIVTLSVPSLQHMVFLNKNWKDKLQSALREVAGKELSIKFVVANTTPPPISDPASSPVTSPNLGRKVLSIEERALNVGLHRGLTFETFVTGNANRVARSSAEIVSQKPGTLYNPFFIYGGVGLGKTHLMHAIGRRMLENDPDYKIVCISAYTFLKEVVALSSGGHVSDEKIKKFDEKYRKLDALLIDDVQLLCQKGGTQTYLFGLMEHLLPSNKQIIFTCDTYARQLSDFDERLISRMTKGLSVGIEPAEFELRAAIVMEKARLQNVVLDEEVAFLIASKVNTNIRELEGALNTVLIHANVLGKPVTTDVVKTALQSISSAGPISIESIQKATAEHFGIEISDMYSKSRKASVVRPRSVAIYLAKEMTQKSLIDIGNAFGGRDHTTVLHAVKKISKERQADQELNHTLHLIEQALKNWA